MCATVDKLRAEVHRERVEKEAVEENCQQLQKMTSQLQEKVGLLTLDQSQSMSVEDHRAALIEMQQWVPVCVYLQAGYAGSQLQHVLVCDLPNSCRMVETFKADTESNSEELAKEVRSLKRDKKALMSKLAGEGAAQVAVKRAPVDLCVVEVTGAHLVCARSCFCPICCHCRCKGNHLSVGAEVLCP